MSLLMGTLYGSTLWVRLGKRATYHVLSLVKLEVYICSAYLDKERYLSVKWRPLGYKVSMGAVLTLVYAYCEASSLTGGGRKRS